jgi:hypothetical protein
MTHDFIPQLSKMLENLGRWLDAGEAYAKQKNVEPKTLLHARLALDQYPLYRQVQAACDAAKFAGARTSGKEPAKHADDEQDFAQLKARIQDVRNFLETIKPADVAGKDDVKVPLPFMPGKAMLAKDYINQLTLPNFYFHVTTAYSILRHAGVSLGKADFIGPMPLVDL